MIRWAIALPRNQYSQLFWKVPNLNAETDHPPGTAKIAGATTTAIRQYNPKSRTVWNRNGLRSSRRSSIAASKASPASTHTASRLNHRGSASEEAVSRRMGTVTAIRNGHQRAGAHSSAHSSTEPGNQNGEADVLRKASA